MTVCLKSVNIIKCLMRWRGSTVEQLICNQQVGSSILFASSILKVLVEGFPSGQRERTVNPSAQLSMVRIHLPPPYMRKWLSGRASPCQGEGREFESRLPLHCLLISLWRYLRMWFSGKTSAFQADDTGSIPVIRSILWAHSSAG